MAKINRDYILKTFLDKLKLAKREGMKELKIPVSFLDDLAYIIYQLMSEDITAILDKIECMKEEEQVKSLPVKKKVFKEIKIEKKPINENIEINSEPNIIEENDNVDNEDEGTVFYGGSW